jgi:ubiquinone/menaquinone biosynthesis C-methylase UbiE
MKLYHPTTVETRAGYDRWSEVYDNDQNPLTALEERNFPAMLGDVSNLTIADVGCGTGRHAFRLAAAGAKVVGIDFSSGMMRKARSKSRSERVHFVAADLLQSLPLTSEVFDRVICCLVLDHIRDLEGLSPK